MKTRITEMLGIEHPILQGGMHYVGFAELAAAVSNAGGLGTITALTQKSPADLASEIAKCRDMTDKPFAVNLTFLPTVNAPDYPGYVKAIIDGGVKIVETAGRNPSQVMPYLKDAGIKVIHKCTSVRHALKAQEIGCDAVSVDGFECGGHPGEDDIPNMILLPRAADELEIPFVSSGGMADGRSLVASLAMGADGMNMGTRFIATQEAPVHQRVKDAIVAASELDTRLVMRPLRNTERVLTNDAVERLLEKERDLGDKIRFEDIIEEVAGVYPKVMLDGDMDAGAWSCGMVAGLINDIPTCQQLVDRIMGEADAIIAKRLPGSQVLLPNKPEGESMDYQTLDYAIDGGVAEITMNRPDNANALNARMADELFDIACRCEAEGTRAVIITGAGKMFNGGGDLAEFDAAANKADHVTRMATMLHAALARLTHLDAPVITAVNGSAGGGGFSIAISGDIVLASDKAKFVSAYTASGLTPDGSSTYYIAKHVGLLRAKELVLTNRVLSAEEACEWGLVTRVVPAEDLMAEARKLAARFAKGPTRAYGGAKRLLETAFSESFEAQLDKETRSIAAMMRTQDGPHGIASFLAKQKPEFKGE